MAMAAAIAAVAEIKWQTSYSPFKDQICEGNDVAV